MDSVWAVVMIAILLACKLIGRVLFMIPKMADVAKKGVSTAENSNGFINNVASDTNTVAPGGMRGEGEEESAGTSSPAAPDLLSFRLPASDEGASLEELIQSELALRIGTANSEEQMDEEEEEEEEDRREAEMRVGAAEEARAVESMGRGTATDGGKGNPPPVDLLLDFTEPTSPLGGEVAIDMFARDAEFPEDVLTPEGVSPDEAPPTVAEAKVGGGRAPWATSEVEEEVVEEVYWEAGEVSDRRVPFIGPAEVSLVDFSTTVTDDSAFDMLTPPTEDKVFGVNIPEIRVDTPPASSPEEEEEAVGVRSESVEEEEDFQKAEEELEGQVEEDFEGCVEERVEQEVEEDVDGEDEEGVDGEVEGDIEGEAEEDVDGEAEDDVDGEVEEYVDGEAEEDIDDETEEDVDGEVEEEVDDEVEEEVTQVVQEVEDEVEDMVGVGGRRVVEIYPRVENEDDGWECVGEVSVEGMEEEGAVMEGLEGREGSKEIDEVEDTSEDLMGDDNIPQKVKEIERREEFREVQEMVDDEVLSEDVKEAESYMQEEEGEEEEEGALVDTEGDLIDTEVAKVVNKVEKIGEMIYEEFTVQEDSVEDTMMNEGVVKDERQSVEEEVVKKESRREVHVMDLVTTREESCEFKVREDKRNGEVVFEGRSAPVKEESAPIGKIVIPSTFGGSGGPSLDDTDRGTSVQHADVSSEFGVPACRPSLVDWNAVVKKEEQKGASGDSVQDVEPPKKAGTRKVKKDSGGEGKKKAKKGKKSDAEKENLSVRSSFNKFDQLSKKTVLHVKSVDSAKVQKQFNEAAAASTGQGPSLCRSCGKQVFQMEQVKAERAIWHRNCFRCKECSKQLTVDIYSSNEGQLYCKPHFRELFKPKAVVEVEDVGPVRPRKPEMIIRENQPVELPPEVVRASDKPDLGLEELTSLDVKSRFKVFEKDSAEESNVNLEKSSSAINVKRSPSILSKLAKFQKKGMDIGVTDDSLNGVPFEQSESSDSSPASSSEDEGDEEGGVVKSSRRKGKRERPVSFGKMDDMKNKWESVGANGVRKTREELREERKEEIQRLRSRLFQGKQGKMKEMYEQAVLESEKGTGATSNGVKRQPSERAKSLKERFEKGETATDLTEDTSEEIRKEREEVARRAKEEELSVFEAGISKKSRSLFLELDKAQKQQNLPPLLPTPKSPQPRDEVRKVREVMTRQISDDVVRSSDRMEDVQVETADICNKFKFFETYQEAPRTKKPFRITPPREGQVKTGSPEREVYRDPTVVRCEDQVGEDDAEVVVKSHTTTKMLSLFRQMEENANKEDVPEGPKPLKRFTPPPDYTRDSDSEEDDDDDEDEDDEEEEEEEEQQQDDQHDPGIIRSSDKIEDEFLKQAMSQNAARAKSLRAKFERWEAEQEKKEEKANGTLGPEDESPSVDTTRNLRARFESIQSEAKSTAAAERRPRVNRFVEIQASCAELCSSCGIRVYPLEKVEAGGKILHKACFRCLQCKCVLRMDTYTMNNGNLYCMTHFKQLFIAKGNYDEGFGSGQHKTKWSSLKKSGKREESTGEIQGQAEPKDDSFNENAFYTKDLM